MSHTSKATFIHVHSSFVYAADDDEDAAAALWIACTPTHNFRISWEIWWKSSNINAIPFFCCCCCYCCCCGYCTCCQFTFLAKELCQWNGGRDEQRDHFLWLRLNRMRAQLHTLLLHTDTDIVYIWVFGFFFFSTVTVNVATVRDVDYSHDCYYCSYLVVGFCV